MMPRIIQTVKLSDVSAWCDSCLTIISHTRNPPTVATATLTCETSYITLALGIM